jgi:glycosyltransferase involved in cell wall biosynthesis
VKILVVAPQPFFSARGTPFSVYYRTQVTCELGHDVDLLTYGQGVDVDIPGCRIKRIPAFRWLGPIRTGPSLQKLFLDGFMIAWTIGLLLRHRYDIVHAHEEAVFWCRWLKPVFRFRLVYDMHSSLPQQLINFEFTRSRVLYKLFEKLEIGAVRTADAVIVICPALKAYAKTLTADEKIVLIENSLCDTVQFPVNSPNPDRANTGRFTIADYLPGLRHWMGGRDPERVIAYAGTLEAYQGIDRLLAAFAIVAARIPDAGLLIVGGLPREIERFRSLADELGIADSVHFTGQVSQPDAQRLVGLAGASISPRVAGNNTPMKIYQLMAAGIPIVATRIESHTQILNDEISILSEVTAEALADAMARVLTDREGSRALGERAQAWYGEQYSRKAYTAKMQKLLSLVS